MATFYGGEQYVDQQIIIFQGSLTNIDPDRLVYTVPTGFYARIRRCTLDWDLPGSQVHNIFHRANGVVNSTATQTYRDKILVHSSLDGNGFETPDPGQPNWSTFTQIELFQPFGNLHDYFLPEGDQILHDYPTSATGQVLYKIILDVYKAP
jgi:hypothetical protein